MVFQRFSRQNAKRPINSIKHIKDEQGGLIAGTQTIVTLADAKDAFPLLADVDKVVTGSSISSIFCNIQVATTGTAALANVYAAFYKNPGNNIVLPNANVIGSSDTKKLFFHQEMLMVEKNTTAFPRTLFKGVLIIPRGMRRMAADDKIGLLLFAPGVNFDYCVQCIYKEYR